VILAYSIALRTAGAPWNTTGYMKTSKERIGHPRKYRRKVSHRGRHWQCPYKPCPEEDKPEPKPQSIAVALARTFLLWGRMQGTVASSGWLYWQDPPD
jgi:hypothetical protein